MGAAVCKNVDVLELENEQIVIRDQSRCTSHFASCEFENVALFCLAAEQQCHHQRPARSRYNSAAAKVHNQENFVTNSKNKLSQIVEMSPRPCMRKEFFEKEDDRALERIVSDHFNVGKCRIKYLKPLPPRPCTEL